MQLWAWLRLFFCWSIVATLTGCQTGERTTSHLAADDSPRSESTRVAIERDEPRIDRQLALDTFDAAWSTVEQTHFDPTFNGVDWHAVRDELRPEAEQAETMSELRYVISDMLSRLGQSHFGLLPSETARAMTAEEIDDDDENGVVAAERPRSDPDRPGTIGADLRLIDGEMLFISVEPDSPAAEAGIVPGMSLRAIGGRDVARTLAVLPDDLDPRMRQFSAWNMVTARLAGDPGSTVEVRVYDPRDDAEHTKVLSRVPEAGERVKFGHLPTFYATLTSERIDAESASVGMIAFNIWMLPLTGQFARAVDEHRDADGIILDLRGNPGGVAGMAMGIAGHFLNERLSLGTMTTRDTQLNIVANPRRVTTDGRAVQPYAGPLAILVDAHTGSTSEMFAAGMQALGRARVFGRTSMGAALPAMMTPMPNGDVLLHAFAGYVDANGEEVEGRGVVPDEEVGLTRQSLLAGRDAPREAAIRWIVSQKTQSE